MLCLYEVSFPALLLCQDSSITLRKGCQIPTYMKHSFQQSISLSQRVSNLLLCRQLLWEAEHVWTLLRIHSSPFAFTAAQMLFRDKPWSWGVEQGTPEWDHRRHRLVLLWAYSEKNECFTEAVPSDPLAVPLAELSLLNVCTDSSHHAEKADRNSWVSFFLLDLTLSWGLS